MKNRECKGGPDEATESVQEGLMKQQRVYEKA